MPNTRSITNVCVEWVIGVVWLKCSILRGTLPIEYVTKKLDEDSPHIDKIVNVCFALCSVCDSVIPFD